MFKIKPFYLLRVEDESGVSGTGIVATGTILPSGQAVMEWTTFHSSLGVYKNIEDVAFIHGHGGKTQVIIGEEITIQQPTKPKKKKKDEQS